MPWALVTGSLCRVTSACGDRGTEDGGKGKGLGARNQGEFLSHGIKVDYFVEENVACVVELLVGVVTVRGLYAPAVVKFL